MSENKKPLSIVWLRRDLRLHDHAALYHALEQPGPVQPVFVFDSEVLARFTNPDDRRLSFIAQALADIDRELKQRGGGLLVLHGKASEVLPKLKHALGAAQVFAAEDYEPAAIARDARVQPVLVKDQLIFDPREVVKDDGTAFKVYTPYSKAWIAKASPASFAPYDIRDDKRYADASAMRQAAEKAGLRVLDIAAGAKALLADIGYRETALPLWPVQQAKRRLSEFIAGKVNAYPTARDHMAEEGTSRLSPYLRFGLVSVRECARAAYEAAEAAGAPKVKADANYSKNGANKWLSELIWREFYAAILYHYPESVEKEWNPAYRGLRWSHDAAHIAAWKAGQTGYPLVDAAMRELLETGWMHNRARMVVASFLTKHLQADWRVGEEHFAQYLMDYEQASNVGGWQWAASTGTDAQPYFRIFNPYLQSKKFDPKGAYIRCYVPELRGLAGDEIHEPSSLFRPAGYPAPIVDHAQAREKALAMFKHISSP